MYEVQLAIAVALAGWILFNVWSMYETSKYYEREAMRCRENVWGFRREILRLERELQEAKEETKHVQRLYDDFKEGR